MLALNERGGSCVGVDFTYNMLKQIKTRQRNGGISYTQADALQLLFKENTFQVVTLAYGLRNFESLENGISEIYRVLNLRGSCFVLEFGAQPNTILGKGIRFYEEKILPTLGGFVSGNSLAGRKFAKISHLNTTC